MYSTTNTLDENSGTTAELLRKKNLDSSLIVWGEGKTARFKNPGITGRATEGTELAIILKHYNKKFIAEQTKYKSA